MWPNLQETRDLVTYTEEIFSGKTHFCALGRLNLTVCEKKTSVDYYSLFGINDDSYPLLSSSKMLQNTRIFNKSFLDFLKVFKSQHLNQRSSSQKESSARGVTVKAKYF